MKIFRIVIRLKRKKMDPLLQAALNRGNPVVFFDVSIGGKPAGRLQFELFKDRCPKTVENFRYKTNLTS